MIKLRAVVPPNINIPKRYAKYLSKWYPYQKLSMCQEVTARLYGHHDWHNLELCIKTKMESGPYNETLDEDILGERVLQQISILSLMLGKVDYQVNYSDKHAFFNISDEEAYQFSEKRNAQLLAETIILETSPTYLKPVIRREVELGELEILSRLPELIKNWWMKNFSYQAEVGSALGSLKFDANSKLDLIRFGRYWGSLSRHYHLIPESMKDGIAYMLALRYADLSLSGIFEVADLKRKKDSGSISNEEYKAKLSELQSEEIRHFLRGYLIPRCIYIFVASPDNLRKSMKTSIKMLLM